ncbi:Mitochondrial genetic interactor of prohibitins [Lachnellula suecica]|uniref:Mitochondrial genetic interactor of prohibitins n=1 Tax=Lachnellula suecica TaxID=602035 RepID=A0A8T9CHY7_9HELO|nr:Mitochondrial genetic interactor of prohibitins [Lachnellula suecica]
MSVCTRSARLAQRLTRQSHIPIADLPAFLCPGILRVAHLQTSKSSPQRPFHSQSQRFTDSTVLDTPETQTNVAPRQKHLPSQCAGCGALSQTSIQDEAGFYTLTRKSVKEYLASAAPQESAEDAIVKAALKNAGEAAAGLELGDFTKPTRVLEPPVCDRCHKLKHHETGVSIHHPSIQSIQDTLFESPYKYNHVYHVIDAADFPMSLIPGIYKLLHLTPQRSLNRRSKMGRFYHGRKTEMSFVITRSDLLAPVKTQVDAMMPYLRSVLRDALGRAAKDVRLGNIRCISAKQSWWTKELKEDIWKRGGGGWMVGKVNVGKSQLFNDVFPKGRKDYDTVKKLPPLSVHQSEAGRPQSDAALAEQLEELQEAESQIDEPLNTSSLLPPVRPETDYPAMPLVSALPGTTASPIRLSFGNGKGELIDLPGLSRGDLELHVQPEHRSSLVMRSRIRPEQQVIKPGQSLLLGGFIRITPTTPDLIMMGYAFTPIEAHLTSTVKAIGTQDQTRESSVLNISLPGTGKKIASAGVFPLKWDVTKERSGPLTATTAAGISPDRLPYRVLATDILIEGCGWVELVAQVRKRPREMTTPETKVQWENERPEETTNPETRVKWKTAFSKETEEPFTPNQDEVEEEEKVEMLADEEVQEPEQSVEDQDWPTVEVFTPNGKFVAPRQPMNAWLYARKPVSSRVKGRPRKSMKGAKKAEKKRVRARM